MTRYAARAFTSETVHLDGQQFVDCEFKRCTMVYSGGEVPEFGGCHFDTCHWTFDGAASRTLAYLRFLYGSGNEALIEGILTEIRGE